MSYRGRLLSLAIVILNTALLILLSYTRQSNSYYALIISIAALYALVGWRLGKKYDQAKYYAEIDELTQVNNRRFALQIFPKLKKDADRKSSKIMIVIIDIDHFKTINDLYSHDIGDQVLRQISDALTDSFRNTDYIIRWGGDEFLVILPNVDEQATAALHIHMQERIKKISIPISIAVSVSVGQSLYPDEGKNLDELIKVADQNMYTHKNSKAKG
ncbi:GGDEF domain-containing protein [Cohnella abietis]|uniref:GGDEF domain-containing protein n=1 Tax=Cohnella abietis TaxID=2507935 RepID=UPI00102EA4AA|nr:GGDEF domain-containing protein [Cohnella abietis]